MGPATYHRMDIARPNAAKEKRKKRIIYGSVAALVLILITVGLSRLKPAAPTVERNLVWIDTVKRGQMLLMEAMGGGLTWGAVVLRL